MSPDDEITVLLARQATALEAILAKLDAILPYLAALADPKG